MTQSIYLLPFCDTIVVIFLYDFFNRYDCNRFDNHHISGNGLLLLHSTLPNEILSIYELIIDRYCNRYLLLFNYQSIFQIFNINLEYEDLLTIYWFICFSLNLLQFISGIGSDNALIFCKIWETVKSDKNEISGEKLVADTLSHAWMSILTASATTSLALFAGYFSDITSIKCFRFV